MNIESLIKRNLTKDLLLDKYIGKHPLSGYCYVASEAYYHLSGGKAAGLKPYSVRISKDIVHWFIKNDKDEIIDLTAEQFDYFDFKIPYQDARARGFLTKYPSKRAVLLMNKVNDRSNNL